jgi:hypothetical protein
MHVIAPLYSIVCTQRGASEVNKLYTNLIKESRPFGAVDAKIVSVMSYGFCAVVQTVELVTPGTELKTVAKKKRGAPPPPAKPPAPRRVLATTVLRKWNQQWRVVLHHAARFTSSPYTGDAIDIPVSKLRRLSAGTTQQKESEKEKQKISKEDNMAKGTYLPV